jgi:hypothetical protein
MRPESAHRIGRWAETNSYLHGFYPLCFAAGRLEGSEGLGSSHATPPGCSPWPSLRNR